MACLASLVVVCVCCCFSNAWSAGSGAEEGKAESIERLTRIIEGKSYPVAAKAAARVERAREYCKQGMHSQAVNDCKAVLELEDEAYYMNPEDAKDIRLAKQKAKALLDQAAGPSTESR